MWLPTPEKGAPQIPQRGLDGRWRISLPNTPPALPEVSSK
jgi:hypothetical protein